MTQKQPKRGKAAFHLFELDTVATKTIADMTRHAVALREQAAATLDEVERDNLRYEAEGVYHEAQRVIAETYGITRRADEVEELVYAAMSAVVMPDTAAAIDYGCDGWE
jgi:hypothetical protein